MDTHELSDPTRQFVAAGSNANSSDPQSLALANALRNATHNAQNQNGQSLQWVQPFSVAPLSVAETDAAFNESHPPGPRGVKRRGGGRPRKPDSELKRPRADPRTRPTRLRPNITVDMHIPSDIWFHIFLFTDYKTVRALRMTCRDTYEATDSVHFWKEYIRRHAYPPRIQLSLTLPNPPPGLTLSQYADLLFGQGCMLCGAAKSKKVQWAFYRRWCKNCFAENTYSDSEAKSITAKYGDILGCIPTAVIDIWRNYHSVSTLTANRISANYRSMKRYVAVTNKDISWIVNECETFLNSLPPELNELDREERLKEWRQEKTVENSNYLAHAKACEDFANFREAWLTDQNAHAVLNYRIQREAFFIEKAAQLPRPMAEPVLQKIPGYQKSIAVKRPPTDRSWREILHNIELYRDKAEQVTTQDGPPPFQRGFTLFGAQNMQGRKGSFSQFEGPADVLLDSFANEAMKELEEAQTAAEDFTFLALQRVRMMYYSLSVPHQPRRGKDDQIKPENGSDRYVLSMQDALNVYNNKIEPRLRAWQLEGKIKRIPKFYCPGCTRRDYRKEWDFEKLFIHLCDAHAKKDLSSPWRGYAETDLVNQYRGFFNSIFHWQGIPWPHNMPILASHHRPSGRWHPDDDDYECAPTVEPKTTTSPFEGRLVKRCSSKSSSAIQVATEAILEASRLLADIKTLPQFKGMIAWQYAIGNIEKLASEPLAPHHLDDLSTELVRNGEFNTFSKVGCNFCDMQLDPSSHRYVSVRSHLKYTEMKHSFDTITRHWKQDHAGSNDRYDVATEMLLFPKESELAYELFESNETGNGPLRDALNCLFPFDDSLNACTTPEIDDSNKDDTNSTTGVRGTSKSRGKRRRHKKGHHGTKRGKGTNTESSSIDQTALNLLAEQAVKNDPRLESDRRGNNDADIDVDDDRNDSGEEELE